ncbi:12317_t:CDS:1 [Funneliformis geosporum]|uniref:12317_t:CDS:1 n=1 Tax=Funneliformis geosporum TaxID=1117311 RepID=A0A9W4SDB6_9GLOM|nr:12317_t:CDS:1 [Funneliformis geosporum]
MKFYEHGDLHSYLDETQGMLCWRDMIDMLWEIAGGIEYIHEKGLFHGNLHGGNILIEHEPDSINTRICDLGLNGPANKIDSNETYGVLPYVAPEVLQGNPITKASDVYSFGILMWTLSAGIRPWCKRPHDLKLASEICNGLRPEIIDGTPNAYIQLMTQCLQSDPLRRPTASELNELLGSWITAICDEPDQSELSDQFDFAEEKKFSSLENNIFHQEGIHHDAFYTSRLLYFPELHNNDEM